MPVAEMVTEAIEIAVGDALDEDKERPRVFTPELIVRRSTGPATG